MEKCFNPGAMRRHCQSNRKTDFITPVQLSIMFSAKSVSARHSPAHDISFFACDTSMPYQLQTQHVERRIAPPTPPGEISLFVYVMLLREYIRYPLESWKFRGADHRTINTDSWLESEKVDCSVALKTGELSIIGL